jgi:hypothetical protein
LYSFCPTTKTILFPTEINDTVNKICPLLLDDNDMEWLVPPASKICVTNIYNVVTHWSEPWNSGHCTDFSDELVVVVSNTIVDIFMKFNHALNVQIIFFQTHGEG